MTSYDIAIVGTGRIAGAHASAISRAGGRARVVAAVDADHGRLLGFAERWAVPRLYRTLDNMLACEQPDLVDLCTPPAVRAEQAIACLRGGNTVLCEQPPARSLAELDAIAEAEAAGRGRFAAVFQHRFGNGARRLRHLAGDARLGPAMTAVCHSLLYRAGGQGTGRGVWDPPQPGLAGTVQIRRHRGSGKPSREGSWEADGGGPTMGHGMHQMDLMLSILGPWRQVVAVAARRGGTTATEDLSCALVTFDSGAVATVVNSAVSPRETGYLRFDFAHATVEHTHLYGCDDADWTVTAAPEHEEQVRSAWARGPHGPGGGYGAQFTAVFEALDAKEPPPVGVSQARATLELVTAVYASAFTGRPVRRGEIGPDSPFYRRMDGSGAPWSGAAPVIPPPAPARL